MLGEEAETVERKATGWRWEGMAALASMRGEADKHLSESMAGGGGVER